MKFQYNDGGRSKYFKAATVGDCVTRAIAIATGRDYKDIYNTIRRMLGYTPRNGVRKADTKRAMEAFGGHWHATMTIGSGCTTHLRDGDLPNTGKIVASCSGHVVAIVDGVINDTYDPSRGENRCVYGYWSFGVLLYHLTRCGEILESYNSLDKATSAMKDLKRMLPNYGRALRIKEVYI